MSEEARLAARAAALAPELARRADEVEKARRVPADLSASLAAAGFYRMFVPAKLGGVEAAPETGSRVFETLAASDASCAWVAFIGATAGASLAWMPEDGARELFASPDTLLTGVFAPTGRAARADGGWRVTGRWQWGSGCENAAWIGGGCVLTDDGAPLAGPAGAPLARMLFFRAADVEILDTWHVAGLRGTGSTDFAVRDLLVPERRAVDLIAPPAAERPLQRFPYFAFLALGVAAVALGIARAAIDDLVALAAGKKRAGSRSTLASRAHTQLEVAQAEARVRSARAFYYESIGQAWEFAVRGDAIPLAARRDLRLATTHAVQASARAVTAMYTLAGGTSVYESSRLQRQFRDVHVATQHVMVSPATLETAGRLFLGVEANTEMF
ncbi:MAG: acyl-CoA dehydrogenase [Proteobacteria bacterium]|nr:MAG: acyl-CoA dehydrogenase [Pseudomonadota bacterium]